MSIFSGRAGRPNLKYLGELGTGGLNSRKGHKLLLRIDDQLPLSVTARNADNRSIFVNEYATGSISLSHGTTVLQQDHAHAF
jgi:hypothetical protein